MVSVIVPVYNVEKYLERCLNSLTKQTFENYEILVINDGSPDKSEEIIKKIQKKYPKTIKYYKKENGGLSDARNYGLMKSKGDYIIFVDSDDYVDKNFIKKLYDKAIETKSDITICGIFDEYEETQQKLEYINYIPQKLCNIYNDKRQMLNRFAAWNKMYKKSIFGDLKFEKNKIYEDLRLIPKLYLKANKISFVNEPLYHYIIRNGSIMTSSTIQKNLDILSAFEDIIYYFKKENVYEIFKDELEYMAIDHLFIATSIRVIELSNFKELKENLKIFKNFMNYFFPNYMNNKYIRDLSRNKKIILKMLNYKQYRLLKLIVKIKR